VETAGVDAAGSEVLAAGAVRVAADGRTEVFDSAGDPASGAPAGESGRADADEGQRGALRAPAVLNRLRSWLGRPAVMVAHDAELVRRRLSGGVRGSPRWLDTLELACVLRPELAAHDLAELGREVVGRSRRAGAFHDAVGTLEVICLLHESIARGEHDELYDVLSGLQDDWGWRPLFGLGGREDLGPLGRAGRRAARRAPAPAPDTAVTSPPAGLPPPGAADLAELFSDEARFRTEMPGYRIREGQIEFTEAIARAFREEKVLAIEAGTGIGKTLGYGLVAFLHALASGERVIISSANRTLQERVVAEELPAIARLLGVPPLPAVVMKGRANYGSPSRARDIATGVSDAGLEDLGIAARLFLVSYFARCPLRDLRSFGGALAERDPFLHLVRERIACSRECDFRVCRREPGGACGYLARVDALAGAGVVSINHSLLLAWPSRYGPIDRLIIDEAHELVGEGDRAFAENLQARDLRGALRRVRTHPTRGVVGVMAARAGRPDLLAEIEEAVGRIEGDVDEVGARLVAVVGDRESVVPAGTLLPLAGPWTDLSVAVERLALEVGGLAARIDQVAPTDAAAPDEESGDQPGVDAIHREAAGLARFFQNAAGGVLGDLFAQSREEHVYAARGYRNRGGGYEWSLTITPLDAAELIHARVLESPRTVVALSATLGVGGDPSATLDKLGWRYLPRDRRLAPLVLPSPFDFANNAVLGLVRGRTYRDDGFVEDCASATAEVARLLGGRTMALFTSRRRLFQVAELLREKIRDSGLRLLVQPPTGGAAGVVESFLSDPRSILLGTRSLWQGIDVPGDALSCVLIDKFPFPQPNDPLLRGRQARLRAAGDDAFRLLSLEPAVVLFKQMFGRLVRNEMDRGFVVVLSVDPGKRYVADFVSSLPGPPRVLVDEMGAILEEMRAFFGIKSASVGRSAPG